MNQVVDSEDPDIYNVGGALPYVVTVEDGVGNANSTNIVINIIDLNDCTPAFTNEPFEGSVMEDAADGSPVGLTVTAVDADVDAASNPVRYFFTNEQLCPFSIVSTTGEIFVNETFVSLDYEMEQECTMIVQASDGQSKHIVVQQLMTSFLNLFL